VINSLESLRIKRASTAERVADALRGAIWRGELQPGEVLKEAPLTDALGVSRNTIREGFRLLDREGLVVHELHRGVVVRRLERADVVDLFRTRRALEEQGVRAAEHAPDPALAAIVGVADAGARAAASERWPDVATANLELHARIVGLVGSERLERFFAAVLAELRLASGALSDLAALHGPYVPRNVELAGLIGARRIDAALAALGEYLRDSEAVHLSAVT
jgi:DNA-binding GntR family transcriptional regulator